RRFHARANSERTAHKASPDDRRFRCFLWKSPPALSPLSIFAEPPSTCPSLRTVEREVCMHRRSLHRPGGVVVTKRPPAVPDLSEFATSLLRSFSRQESGIR